MENVVALLFIIIFIIFSLYGLYQVATDFLKGMSAFIRHNPVFPYVYFILFILIAKSNNIYGDSLLGFFLYYGGVFLFYKFLKFLFVEENNKIPYKKPELIIEPSKQPVIITTPKPEPEQKQELEAKPTKFSEVTQSIDDNIEVLPEYKKVLSNLLSSEQTITFVTGGAGTGKSYLIKWLKSKLSRDYIALLAPTGIAAINIGGMTIHSFCRFKPAIMNFKNDYETDPSYCKNSRLYAIANQIKYLIIDEISMVRCDLLDGVNDFFCYFRQNYKPFGGINVLFVGDLYQLPPVVEDSDKDDLKKLGYEFPCYCFYSKVWRYSRIEYIELEKQQRQKSKEFYEILTQVRFGNNGSRILDYFNNKCFNKDKRIYPYLTLTRNAADNINQTELKKITNQRFLFEGEFWSKNNNKKWNKDTLPAPENLLLKVGARVMTLKNASDRSYVNGSIGEIIDIYPSNQKLLDSVIAVRLLETGKIVEIKKDVWEKYRYEENKNIIDEKDKKYKLEVVETYTQIPLILAYAITIHKAQGLTLPTVTIYKGQGNAFAPGQTYVALSRCPTIDNIALDTILTKEDIFSDDAITKEYIRLKLLQ